MKKLHKLAAAVAVAAGIALSPQSQAIELKTGGVGDALLFPVFAAGAGMYENYFTISNSSNNWVQSHLRFRGSAWSAELLDFDVILSPGDVFVFRLADVDGDGEWEVDGSLDPRNFQYTGMVFSCTGPVGTRQFCIDANNLLEPPVAALTAANIPNAADVIALQRRWGYIEFIGEAILNGMTTDIMNTLLGDNPGTAWSGYVTTNGNRRGTNSWRWSDAQNDFRNCAAGNNPCDRGLSDVPNALSGTAFIVSPGQSSGLAYNAEALLDFRTANFPHRIDNYDRVTAPVGLGAPNNAVILHHENSNDTTPGPSPWGDYIYTTGDSRDDECVIRFNNTWGPTLADGDDYLPTSIPAPTAVPSVIPGLPAPASSAANATLANGNLPGNDAWDQRRSGYGINGAGTLGVDYNGGPTNNSITEVEMAIRSAQLSQRTIFNGGGGLSPIGQIFTSFYFDSSNTTSSSRDVPLPLQSLFLGFFPTKFYYSENAACSDPTFIQDRVIDALRRPKPITIEVWNTDEVPCVCVTGGISPSLVTSSSCNRVLGYELNIWDIDWLKGAFTDGNCPGYRNGRTVVRLDTSSNRPGEQPAVPDGFPGMLYTFEMSSVGTTLANWRSMHKR